MILKHLVPTFHLVRDQTAGAASPVKTSDQTIGTTPLHQTASSYLKAELIYRLQLRS